MSKARNIARVTPDSSGVIPSSNLNASSFPASFITSSLGYNPTDTANIMSGIYYSAPIYNNSLNASGTFTLSYKTHCFFFWTGSAYSSSSGLMSQSFSVDGYGTLNTVNQYTNEASSHKSFPTGFSWLILNPGTYTARITSANNVDSNDRGSCFILGFRTA